MSCSDKDVLSSNSVFHWRAAVTLVARMSVEARTRAMHAIPTIVLPAPHGSTITPEPPRSAPPA